MTIPLPGRGTRLQGVLALADISGYTGFLQGVQDAHPGLIIEGEEPPPAYAVVSSLLDALVSAVVPPFRLAKLEGDAMFVVADEPQPGLLGEGLLDCIRGCFAAFGQRLADAQEQWTCSCDGCSRIGRLDVKFVIHHGSYVQQSIMGHQELAGRDVIVVHRLLKNHAREATGGRPYALISDAAMEALGVPDAGLVPLVETYDDLPPVPAHVLAL